MSRLDSLPNQAGSTPESTMTTFDWQKEFENEIGQARLARASGNEGMARVCARRAAGIVIGEFLSRNGYPSPSASAYDRLRFLESLPEIAESIQEAVGRLILRVTPEHQLPTDADLINDAVWLREALIPDC
jgi:hypothetical protein